MRESSLLRFAKPETIIHLAPLADEQNAAPLWREALTQIVRPDEIADLVTWLEPYTCDIPDCPEFHGVEPPDFEQHLTANLQDNAPSLRLFREGLRRNELRISIEPPNFEGVEFHPATTKHFFRLLKLEEALHSRHGRWDEAVTVIEEILRGGRLVAHSAIYIHFLVGLNLQGMGIARAGTMLDEHPPRAAIERLLTALEGGLTLSDQAQVLKREFCLWAIPNMERFETLGSLTHQVDYLIRIFYSVRPMLVDTDDWADDGRIAQRDATIRELLRDHPHPWDAADTVRCVSEFVAIEIAAVNAATIDPETGDLKIEKVAWPDPIQSWWPEVLRMPYDYLGDSEQASAARRELVTSMNWSPEKARELQPLTPAELPERRELVQQVMNPLGRLAAQSFGRCYLSVLSGTLQRTATLRKKLVQALEDGW